jgi:hypothetical protein
MAAHWELAKLSLGALKLGPRAWWPMTRLFGNMIRRMGLGWVGGYLASLWKGVGKSALAAVERELAGRSLTLDSPVIAGSTVTFRFRGEQEGLGLAEFSGDKLVELRLFQEMNGKSALRSAG